MPEAKREANKYATDFSASNTIEPPEVVLDIYQPI
jgi:hypothetical protein